MSRNFTIHTGGIPGPPMSDPNANGCCSMCIDLFFNGDGVISGWQMIEMPTTKAQCRKEAEKFLEKLDIQIVNGRLHILNAAPGLDISILEDYINKINIRTNPNIFFRFNDVDCAEIRGSCCTNTDEFPFPLCVKDTTEHECINLANGTNTVTDFFPGAKVNEDCQKLCDGYVVVCKTRYDDFIDGKIGPIFPYYKHNCTVLSKSSYRSVFYLDENGDVQPVGNKTYRLSNDTNLYAGLSTAVNICDGSKKWICITPQDDPSIRKPQCVQISTLCYDVPDGTTLYNTSTECILNSECDIKCSVTIFNNFGCNYVSCTKDLSKTEIQTLIQNAIDEYGEDQVVYYIDQNNICNEQLKTININDFLQETRGEECLQCVDHELVNIVENIDECLECVGKVYNMSNEFFGAIPKCEGMFEHYNYETGECETLEAGPCQKIVIDFERPLAKNIGDVRIDRPCIFWKIVDVCGPNEKCCNGQCIPIDDECVEPEPKTITLNKSFSQGNIPIRYDCSRIDYGQDTINVPEDFNLPVNVTIAGVCDDTLVINGEIAEGGTQSTTFVGNCPIWSGPWTFELNSSSFTIAVADLVGVNAGYDLNITITEI